MTLRIFGSETCEKCRLIVGALTLLGKEFQFIDALADENQDLCDLHDVNELPHIQLLDDEGKVVWQHAKLITLSDLLEQLKQHEVK